MRYFFIALMAALSMGILACSVDPEVIEGPEGEEVCDKGNQNKRTYVYEGGGKFSHKVYYVCKDEKWIETSLADYECHSEDFKPGDVCEYEDYSYFGGSIYYRECLTRNGRWDDCVYDSLFTATCDSSKTNVMDSVWVADDETYGHHEFYQCDGRHWGYVDKNKAHCGTREQCTYSLFFGADSCVTYEVRNIRLNNDPRGWIVLSEKRCSDVAKEE